VAGAVFGVSAHPFFVAGAAFDDFVLRSYVDVFSLLNLCLR